MKKGRFLSRYTLKRLLATRFPATRPGVANLAAVGFAAMNVALTSLAGISPLFAQTEVAQKTEEARETQEAKAPETTVASASEAPEISEETKKQVARLLKDLGSPVLSKRTEAENALLNLGAEILPLLPENARSPEAKMRLNRIRIALERQNAEESLEAGLVTFRDGVDVQDIPDWIVGQTQNQLEINLSEKQTFSWKNPEKTVPFWVFLDSFCDQLQLAPQTIPGKKGLKLVPSRRSTPRSASENPRIAYLKPFRLEPVRVVSSILTASDVPSFLLQLELSWEPRIQPVFAYLKLTEADFFDASGQKISDPAPLRLPQLEHEILIGKTDFRSLCDIALPINAFPHDARSMNLRGSLSAVACGAKKDFAFSNLESKLNQTFSPEIRRTAAVLVMMTDLRSESVQNKEKTDCFLIAGFRYRYEESHDAMESHRTWIYENDAVLQGPDGRKILSQRSELLRQTPNEIAVEIYFPITKALLDDMSDWKLIFPRPSGIYEVEYPFELCRIPIP